MNKIKNKIPTWLFILIKVVFMLVVIGVMIFLVIKYEDFSFDGIGVIIASVALLVTIFYNYKEKERNILITKNIRDQEKFEEEIKNILQFLTQLFDDYVNSMFIIDSNLKSMDNHLFFDMNSLNRISAMNIKYTCSLRNINNNQVLLYKYHNVSHPEYDKFRIKLDTVNGSILNIISEMSVLVGRCYNFETGYTKEEINEITNTRNLLMRSLTEIYKNNIDSLYVLANNCIEERNHISTR